MGTPRLVLAMLVRNESGRYLRQVLEAAVPWVDAAAILDDASTDGTADDCRHLLHGVESVVRTRPDNGFSRESVVRRELWDMALSLEPDWVLVLDADEILDEGTGPAIRALTAPLGMNWLGFRLYDMWSPTHYRDDELWSAHRRHFVLATRVHPGLEYHWSNSPQHCGRLPLNALQEVGVFSEARVLHMGWSTQADREAKFLRYLQLDPRGVYGNMAQYESILDPSPNLLPLHPSSLRE